MNDQTEVLQMAFDKACAGVINQGRRSCFSPANSFTCAYRGFSTGMACSVGHLMTDEQMKKYGIKETQPPFLFPKELLQELLPNIGHNKAVDFLVDLRGMHDKASHLSGNFIADFKRRANEVANMYNLKGIE